MSRSLKIIGVGTRRFHQLTLEGLAELKRARRVLFLEIDQKEAEDFFKEHGIHSFENLGSRYKDGEIDLRNYDNIVEHVMSVVGTHDRVALLVAGHPRLGVYLTSILEAELQKTCEVTVLEGISSFATMTNLLKRDPLEKGTVIVDANRLLLFAYHLEPQVDTYIFHVCSVANPRTDFSNPARHNRLDLLLQALLRWYSPEHLVAFVSAPIDQKQSGRVEWFPLRKLQENATRADFSVSLFIPGVKPTRLENSVLEIMKSRTKESQ